MANVINATSTGNGGLVSTGDDSGILNIQTNETTAITVDASQRVAFVAGTAALPAITTTGDTNTGIYFPAADTIAFSECGTESMRIDSSGNVLQNTTTYPFGGSNRFISKSATTTTQQIYAMCSTNDSSTYIGHNGTVGILGTTYGSTGSYLPLAFYTSDAERMRITSGGNVGIGTTSTDGALVSFRQDNNEEGSISVSGTTVSYNGGHLSRWAQMLTKPDLLKGTVMSNLDAMNVYTDADGNPVENEQLNKVKVSDVEGDANVAGVFVNWTYDEAHQVEEINMAMTGDMIIRIAQGVTVQRGDLLMSAGDGTAKAQGDDIVRSKTIAKVTSNHVTCTYADGSYCVPCVLMAC